jgi:hypothetical protein
MKKAFCGRVFLFIGMCWLGQGTVKCTPLVAEPTIKIIRVSPSGSITLEIGNHFKEPLKLWEESNSWGAARWRILRIRHGQIEAFFQNPYQIFTVNVPTVDEIAAGGHLERALDLNGGNWCGFGHCDSYNERGFAGKKVSFEPNDSIIVIYDVPPTKEAQDMSVWHGVAAAFKTVE